MDQMYSNCSYVHRSLKTVPLDDTPQNLNSWGRRFHNRTLPAIGAPQLLWDLLPKLAFEVRGGGSLIDTPELLA